MMTRVGYFPALLTFLLLVSPSVAEEAAPAGVPPGEGEPVVLSLRECVELALEGNPDVAVERIRPAIAAEAVRGESGAFDPVLSLSLAGGKAKSRLTAQSVLESGIPDSVRIESIDTSTGLTGMTPIGLEYGLSYSNTMIKDTYGAFQSEYSSLLGLTLTQPLLKDAGPGAALASLRIAKKDREISDLEWERYLMAVIVIVADAYWDLVFAARNLDLQTEFLDFAEALLAENEKRLEAGTVAAVEVIQSRAGVAARRESVFTALKTLRTSEVALKRLVAADLNTWLGRPVVSTDSPVTKRAFDPLHACVEEGLARRPEILSAQAQLEQSEISLKYAGNQLLPRVDLEGGYYFDGLDSNAGNGFDVLVSGRYPQWWAGLTFEMPLGRRADRSARSVAELETRQAEFDLRAAERDVVAEIEVAQREAEIDLERIGATEEASRLALEALEAEERKLRIGRSTSRDVLLLQEDLARARLHELDAVVDYNRSLIELDRARGAIFDRFFLAPRAREREKIE